MLSLSKFNFQMAFFIKKVICSLKLNADVGADLDISPMSWHLHPLSHQITVYGPMTNLWYHIHDKNKIKPS